MINWGYIAGFFDGEGSVGLSRNKRTGNARFYVSIAQSEKNDGFWVLSKVAEFLRAHGVSVKSVSGSTNFNLQINNLSGIRAFLEGVLPYLMVKKVLAQDCLRYLIMYPDLTPYRYEIRRMLGKDPSNYRGEKVYCAKLRSEQIPQIRTELNEQHDLVKDIASRYGISQGAATSIKVGRTWKGIPSCL